ncbi:MAG: hypothetical protein ABGY75_11210, partial [Gemmataceae bacterium]
PDCPGDDVHNGMSFDFLRTGKAFDFDGHDYLPKNLLKGYMTKYGVYIKAKDKGKTTVAGEVKGDKMKLDVKLARREPHLEKDKAPVAEELFANTGLTTGAKWTTSVDTAIERHGSVLTMEFTLDGKAYPVRFVLPVMDPLKKSDKSTPDKGVYVFKIAAPK